MDENGSEILAINSSWILVANGLVENGIGNFVQADLLDYSPEARWIRGIFTYTPATVDLYNEVKPTSLAPDGLFVESQLTDYYLSLRKEVTDKGLCLLMSTPIFGSTIEDFLLDATPQTPERTEDMPLLLGSTYSDYSADRHFTPIRRGGTEVMPWIEVVVHHDTIKNGLAKVPNFDFAVTNKSPSVNEYVQFSAMVEDGNTSEYAYSWFINEQMLDDIAYLNQPSFFKSFSQPGKYIVRVVVSDMRGGLASQNLEVIVDGEETQNYSTVSGTVRSSQGNIQGARVLVEPAPVIEHTVSVIGDLKHSFFVNGKHEPLRYQIDGQINPDLMMRRGEVHRFYFDSSTRDYPLTFLNLPENAPPRVKVNMLTDARVDNFAGKQYKRNPSVYYTLNSGFGSYLSTQVGDYLSALEFLIEDLNNDRNTSFSIVESNTSELPALLALQHLKDNNFSRLDSANLITRPFARALMQETNISTATVGPTVVGEAGYLTFGGRGYSPTNTPIVEVRRSSIWEDYNKSNAIAVAKVDGVNTISPVTAESFLGATWRTRPGDTHIPDLVVWGSGGGDTKDPYSEVNASIEGWSNSGGDTFRTITILNQGKGFEPNSTMAVLHYPVEPFAYWTFDRHETLFGRCK